MTATGERIVIIDCQVAGVSGDMMLGALVDLGASLARVSEALKVAGQALNGCQDLRIEAKGVTRHGIHAHKADIKFAESATERSGAEIKAAIVGTAESLRLSPRAREFARKAIDALIDAEARVHRCEGDHHHVHFHEMGSADTVADILGVAVALEDLGLFEVTTFYTTPVAVGSGTVKFSHGTVSVPAPATLEILRTNNLPFAPGAAASELATPTGVSLIASLAPQVTTASRYPPLKPTAVGYGAGTKEFPEMANVLRIVIGEPIATNLLRDSIYVLETNIDDVPGEVVGYTVDRLLKEGARDFHIIPVFTKKNRPGQILRVIADEGKTERLAQVLIEETGTLGVRFFPCERYVLARESLSVDVSALGAGVKAEVKVARDKTGRIIHLKPEYENAKALAEKTGRPLREVLRLIQTGAWDAMSGEGPGGSGQHQAQGEPDGRSLRRPG